MSAKDLGINVNDNIKSQDAFGKAREQALKGIAGTLHLTKKEDCAKIVSTAWRLSEHTKLPVVIVVRAMN